MAQNGTMEPGVHDTNDPMTLHAQGAGVWGSPGADNEGDAVAELPPQGFDYGAGMFVGLSPDEADAVPGTLHPTIVAKLATNEPAKTFTTIHESTHRRFDAPRTVSVEQLAAGTTMLVPTQAGLHYIKLLAAFITLDGAGTLQFVQGSNDGLTTAAMSGVIPLAASGSGFVLPPARIETPWFFTHPDQSFGIITATAKAHGFITYCYSPYDA